MIEISRSSTTAMRFQHVFLVFGVALVAHCEVRDRLPLSFAPIPDGTYIAPVASNVTTLLDFIRSQDELSILLSMVEETGGNFAYLLESHKGSKKS